jgi:hypothetical protein|tara:strand:+ start:177 stop:512 length:336 start_codon:yes stop_codon:yes gene_type:complete
MHGEGVYKWPNGRMYKGSYVNDKKEGYGIYVYPDGRQYAGNWEKGVQHGEGNFTSPSGVTRKGTWKEGKRLCWQDGQETGSNYSGTVSLASKKFRGASSAKGSKFAPNKKQ